MMEADVLQNSKELQLEMDSSASGIPLKKDSDIALTRDAWEKHKDKIPDASDSIENIGTWWNSKFKIAEGKEEYFKSQTWMFLLLVRNYFPGDTETFCLKCYKLCVDTIIFIASFILCGQNHILAHLTGAIFYDVNLSSN